MSNAARNFRRIATIAAAWTLVWLLFWTLAISIIAVADPDSIDPGEQWMALVIFGPMGILTGLAFGAYLNATRRTSLTEVPLRHAAVWGFLATALVQVLYLGHGDAGLTANVKMALLFAAIGSMVTIALVLVTRLRQRRPSAPPTATS